MAFAIFFNAFRYITGRLPGGLTQEKKWTKNYYSKDCLIITTVL